MKKIMVLLALFVSIITMGQSTLIPSKKAFQSKWVQPEKNEMIFYAVRDTTKFEVGRVLTEIQKSNTALTLITQVAMKGITTKWIDSSIADITTLKPIFHSSYNIQRDMVLNFGKIVTGYYNDKTKHQNTNINDTTSAEYFDSNLYTTMIRWLPLKDGYHQDIAIYDYNPSGKNGVLKATVTNVESGTYSTQITGIKNVWIVTVADNIAKGDNSISKYYIDKVDRKLWQQEIVTGGRKMLMQLVEN